MSTQAIVYYQIRNMTFTGTLAITYCKGTSTTHAQAKTKFCQREILQIQRRKREM